MTFFDIPKNDFFFFFLFEASSRYFYSIDSIARLCRHHLVQFSMLVWCVLVNSMMDVEIHYSTLITVCVEIYYANKWAVDLLCFFSSSCPFNHFHLC